MSWHRQPAPKALALIMLSRLVIVPQVPALPLVEHVEYQACMAKRSSCHNLHISESHLTGTLPTELGSLRSLTTLYLYNNFLSGTIPSEMGCMPNLTIISLHTNKVGGPLPSELANLKKLKHMDFNNNLLTRTIPSELGSLVNLDGLYELLLFLAYCTSLMFLLLHWQR